MSRGYGIILYVSEAEKLENGSRMPNSSIRDPATFDNFQILLDDQTMGKYSKIRHKILSGSSDTNIEFVHLCQLLIRLGFEERVRGSHHIFSRDGVEEIVNLQSSGSKAKPYQVKQIRNIMVKYRLGETYVD